MNGRSGWFGLLDGPPRHLDHPAGTSFGGMGPELQTTSVLDSAAPHVVLFAKMIPAPVAPRFFNRSRPHLGGSSIQWLVAIAYLALALLACRHVILDNKTMGPEVLFQEDRLYGYPGQPTRRMYDDPTPVCIDYPRDLTIATSIHSGQFFTWNPWSATGVPLAAEQGGVFFPLRILFYLFPNPQTYDAFRISRLLLAALGAYALARSRGCSRGASFVAGGLFELSGPMVWMAPFAATSAAYVLPLLLLSVRRLFSRSADLSSIVALGVTMGLVLLGGHPGIGAVCLSAAACAFAGESVAFARSGRSLLRALGGAAVASVLGLLLSAPSVLPFAELLARGHTYKHTGVATAIWHGDLAATRATFGLGLFTPRLVNVLRDSYPTYPYSLNGVCGLTGLLLALIAVWQRRVRFGLLLVACLGIVLSFGPLGYSSVAGSIPLLQYILPRYCVVLVILPISQWAAEGLDSFPWWRAGGRVRSWRTPPGSMRLGRLLVPLGVLSSWLCIAYLCHAAMAEPLQAQIHKGISESSDQRFRYFQLGALVGLAMVAGRISLRAGRLSLGSIAVLELALYAMPHFNEPVSGSLRHGRPSAAMKLAQLAKDSHSRIGSTESTLGLTQFNLVDAIPDIRITAALVPKRYYDYMRLLGADFYTIFVPPAPTSPLLDMAAVKFFALSTAAADGLTSLMPIDGGGIYLNPYAAPRARLLGRVSTVADEPQALEWLGRAATSSRHLADSPLRERAVIEADERSAAELRQVDLEGQGGTDAPGSVAFERDEPDHVSLRVSAPGYRVLVLADTFYPGWHARIDGRERRIFAANVLFRGVVVPPGVHQVTFDYRPLSLWLGCVIALCTWGVVAARVFRRRASA